MSASGSAEPAVPHAELPLAVRVHHLLDGATDGVLPILPAGHPVLREVAVSYHGELEEALLGELVVAMRATMRAAPGVGLAAPQIGLGIALAVLEDPGTADVEVARVREREAFAFRVVVNPRYTPVGSERVEFYEGCLSLPGWTAVRSRWRTVRLEALDASGVPVDEVLTGWAARIVQHERDHLAGERYLDRAQLRSLAHADMAARWAKDPIPTAAAAALGFPLTGS